MDTFQVSRINATISKIERESNLHIVTFQTEKLSLKMMSLELQKDVAVGDAVVLFVKATTVGIAKDIHGELSFSNQIPVRVKALTKGRLLTSLLLEAHDFSLESLITTESTDKMQLKEEEQLIALIKSSDLSIVEYLS